MKKKLVGLALIIVMVLSLNVIAYASGGGGPWDIEPLSVRLCIDTELE